MPAILAVRMALWVYPSQGPVLQATKDAAASMILSRAKRPSLLRRPFDLLFVLYFFIHVPITVLFDAQSVVGVGAGMRPCLLHGLASCGALMACMGCSDGPGRGETGCLPCLA